MRNVDSLIVARAVCKWRFGATRSMRARCKWVPLPEKTQDFYGALPTFKRPVKTWALAETSARDVKRWETWGHQKRPKPPLSSICSEVLVEQELAPVD